MLSCQLVVLAMDEMKVTIRRPRALALAAMLVEQEAIGIGNVGRGLCVMSNCQSAHQDLAEPCNKFSLFCALWCLKVCFRQCLHELSALHVLLLGGFAAAIDIVALEGSWRLL